MRLIQYSSTFKKDFKRESKGIYRKVIEVELAAFIDNLACDIPLAAKYKNHPLIGTWSGFWECHMKPDLLLIYKKTESNGLLLARLGSHSELF